MRASKGVPIGPSLGVLLACLLAACSSPPPASAPPDGPKSAPAAIGAKASVLVISEPPMASVAIDGRDTGRKTPTSLTGLDAGRTLRVVATLDGYEPYETDVTLQPGEGNRLMIPQMKKLGDRTAAPIPTASAPANAVGTIEATSSDPNAKFFIGGVEIGTGSLSIRVVSSEPGAALRVEATQPSGGPVSARAGGGSPAPLGPAVARAAPDAPPPPTMNSVGTIQLSSSDPKAKLHVDGALIGTGSAAVKVAPGRHSVRATNARGDSKESSVDVEAGAEVSKHLSLERADEAFPATPGGGVGKLLFIVKPWAEVYVNDQIIGTTPFAAREFPAGSYRVRLVNKDLGKRQNFTVKVEAGQTTKVLKNLGEGE